MCSSPGTAVAVLCAGGDVSISGGPMKTPSASHAWCGYWSSTRHASVDATPQSSAPVLVVAVRARANRPRCRRWHDSLLMVYSSESMYTHAASDAFLPSTQSAAWRGLARRGGVNGNGRYTDPSTTYPCDDTQTGRIQDAEVRRLAGMLSKMDEDSLKQRKEYDQVRRPPWAELTVKDTTTLSSFSMSSTRWWFCNTKSIRPRSGMRTRTNAGTWWTRTCNAFLPLQRAGPNPKSCLISVHVGRKETTFEPRGRTATLGLTTGTPPVTLLTVVSFSARTFGIR